MKNTIVSHRMSNRYNNAKYMTIAETIIHKLQAGEFQALGHFYSRDELAQAYNISPGTARAVLRALEEQGVIECRKGKRPVPVCGLIRHDIPFPYRAVFFRDSFTAETSEYDYIIYCAKNILMHQKESLLEYCFELTGQEISGSFSPRDVVIVFPSPSFAFESSIEHADLLPQCPKVNILIDHAESNAISIFTRKTEFDCLIHLIRHNISTVVHIASKHSLFPWFKRIAESCSENEYAMEFRSTSVMYDDEPEMFPDFLAENVSRWESPNKQAIAFLIDNPDLSYYLSSEIRTGTYRPPSRFAFYGTALCKRSMSFPYLDLGLDSLTRTVLQAVCSKARNPTINLPCEFHQLKFNE